MIKIVASKKQINEDLEIRAALIKSFEISLEKLCELNEKIDNLKNQVSKNEIDLKSELHPTGRIIKERGSKKIRE